MDLKAGEIQTQTPRLMPAPAPISSFLPLSLFRLRNVKRCLVIPLHFSRFQPFSQ